MKLFDGNRGYSCFVCHASGDVISLVRNYYHDMSFPDTIRWFSATFHLGIDIESPLSPDAVKQAENARKTRERERAFREWKDRMCFDLALTADQIVELMEEQRDKYAPKTMNETWHPRFCEAVEMLPAAREFAEDCYYKCIEVRK